VTEDRTRARLSLAIEHFQNAIRYGQRGRDVFFDEDNPDTFRLVEGELRKAFESLNRQGDRFFNMNPTLDRVRIAETRQLLTHDYADIDPKEVWRMLAEDVPRLLRRLRGAKLPK
jgi:uncharacterized protein with HEPN domain